MAVELGGDGSGGREALTEETVRDWFRLKMLVQVSRPCHVQSRARAAAGVRPSMMT